MTEPERARCDTITKRLDLLRGFLTKKTLRASDDLSTWYKYLAQIKAILGNLNNDLSFVATLMAKRYLAEHHPIPHFDAAAKAQGVPGLDIDFATTDGQRIVAEIKTIEPYLPGDFGAQQKKTFRDDFPKLNAAQAAVKYLFVTETRSYDVLRRKYAREIPGVRIVLLASSDQGAV